MKISWDFLRAETMATLKTVGEYHSRMEQQLSLLRETKEAFLRAECKDWEEFQAEMDEFEWTFKQLFPRCLRYSFVVFLYSVIETELMSFCREFSKRRKLPPLNLNGKKFSLQRCKPYLTNTIGIDLKGALDWNRLRVLETVRNCIAHVGGRLEESKDKASLDEAVRARIGLSLSKHPISKGRLDIDTEFCKSSTEAAIDFFMLAFGHGRFGPETPKELK